MIKIVDLHKSYDSKSILKGINTEFSRGKIYGIIGENGAGKTTLFRCIAGLERFDGEITSDLQPLKNYLGLLFAEPYFFDKITGEEYIRLLCNARHKVINGITDKNILDLPLSQYVSTYSTGMKKKLALLAVLLQGNEFFVLDEPYNGIDINGSIVLTEILLKLKELNKIVLLSSHIFSTLRDTCDEILVLKNGTFTKHVYRDNFDTLEDELKSSGVKDLVGRLGL
ncbi:MAG: ATP-binding cassette domain-containing protein [Bacteroidales bacterium]|nr:ATP-binding cassette domain-containing protein [Bacteroidales bacterium]